MKRLILKHKNKILFISGVLILGDLMLIITDALSGEEKGVLFGYQLAALILYSNILFIGCIVFLALLVNGLSFVLNRSSKHIQNIIIPLVSTIVLIFIVELIFYAIPKLRTTAYPYAYDSFTQNLFRKDSILGYSTNKNVFSKYRKILIDPAKPSKDTSFVFDTVVKTDSLGNRLIDIPGMHGRKKYALFFGCSFTFGVGVEDNATIPYYFAKFDTSFCAYNFALGGYGTQNMLAMLEHTNIRNLVRQDSGVCFYIYMNAHPGRVIGDMYTYTNFGHDMPYYSYKNDTVAYSGSFSEGRKLVSGFYTLMSKSNFIKYFNINFPPKILPRHYKLTCDIIYKSFLEYKKQFHNNNFYVVLYPSSGDIAAYLKSYNIKVLDFSKLFDASEQKYFISVYDKHPTPLANEILANELMKRVQ